MLERKHLLTAAVALAAASMTAQAQISATQAREAAVARVPGRIVDVDYHQRSGQYEVDVIAADGRRHEVRIDGKSGRVLDSRLDRDDDDDRQRMGVQSGGRVDQDDRDDDDDDRNDRDDDRDDNDRDNDRDDNDND